MRIDMEFPPFVSQRYLIQMLDSQTRLALAWAELRDLYAEVYFLEQELKRKEHR